ncbi:anthrone oxygenase family protein [Paractinoplanes ferrugineus]|nr:DUF1772 domain-containing protein [Actinoplanes ferrugineus]
MRLTVLLAATITTGMMAGLFYAYSISVMPALRGADAAVLVEVMQRINRAITNGWFFLCFAGALVFSAAATVLYAIDGPAEVLLPTAIGLVLYAGQLVLTAGLHIPLNNALEAAGSADPAAARRAFEPRWVRWNHARTLLCTGSFVSLCGALAQV